MPSIRTSVGIVLIFVSVLLPVVASAQSPYVISGLHTDMTFSEALVQAEKLGGICQLTSSRSQEEGKIVQCKYKHCMESNRADGCDAEDQVKTGLTFALQPIVQIGLEAPADTARLTRIVMVYDGDIEEIAAGLIQAFGATETNGAPTDTQSWSNARRWSWRAGQYRMGLVDAPPLIILATDQSPALPAADDQPALLPKAVP